MRKITVISMITLDGVMQAPGGPDEDRSGGFEYGGWSAPFGDEISAKIMQRLMKPSDLLLGRKTFNIWENYWPRHADLWPGINDVTKYVFSSTMNRSEWSNSVFMKSLEEINLLKNADGSDLQVWGSSQLIQLLLKHDLVDELWIITYPLTLGQGKKLFMDGAIPAAFRLIQHGVTTDGVFLGHYVRNGTVQTGMAGPP